MTKQINLLPDIKRERIQQKQREQLIKTVSFSVMGVMAFVALLVAGINFMQNRSLVATQEGIVDIRNEIEAMEDKEVLVGMQTALSSLPRIDEGKLHSSLLPEMLEQTIPGDVRVSTFEFTAFGTLEMTVEAESYRSIYTLVDSLENTQGTRTAEGEQNGVTTFNLFNNVELVSTSHGDLIVATLVATIDPTLLMNRPSNGAGDDE